VAENVLGCDCEVDMRKTIVISAIATLGLLVTGAIAQHEEHHQDQTAPPASTADAGKTSGMMSGNMMAGGMMAQMPKMMAGQAETGRLADQLRKSFAAIEAEKNPAARREKLERHGELLRALQENVQNQARMMDMMHQTMGGFRMGGPMKEPMPGGEHKN
jgi:hypothetical protein